MSTGEFLTLEQQALLRMVREAGTPQDAGKAIVDRLEQLETQVAELEAHLAHAAAIQAADEALATVPPSDAEVGSSDK